MRLNTVELRSTLRLGRRGLALLTFVACAGGSLSATAATLSATLKAKSDEWVVTKLGADGTTDMLVILPQQADLSLADTIKDKTQRGTFVYETLRAHAESTQGDLRTFLAQRGVEFRPFWVSNMIHVRGDAALAEALAARNDVKRLAANPVVKLKLPTPEQLALEQIEVAKAVTAVEPGVTKISAPSVWALGYTGQGVVVGGQDTGYMWDHASLKSKYRGWNGASVNHNYNWYDAIHGAITPGGTPGGVCGLNSQSACDDDTHGTHTMGTMVGDDGGSNQIGVAPGAKWIGCRNMDRGAGTPTTYAECFQWFIAPTDVFGATPDPTKAPHVINNSWGCPPEEGCTDPNVLKTVVENVQAAGIVVVVSAGNDGPSCATVNTPAPIYDASFSVAATSGTSPSDALASFSSRGPVAVDGSNRLKPDIAAPGVSVRSSLPGSGTGYGSKSGTSMAGPHVAGAVAVLMSAYPALAGNPDAVKRAFKRTAVRRTETPACGSPGTIVPNNSYGWGRIDLLAAYNGAPTATLDIDVNTTLAKYASLSDGLLVTRHLLGLTGNALTDGALAPSATVTNPVSVKARLDAFLPALDVDGNGTRDAATDGVLIMRYLLGIRGPALIQGAVAGGAPRATAPDIEAYIKLLIP